MKLALSVLILMVGAACAAPTVLKDYPKDQIDRPYTLPEGLATWETWATGGYKTVAGGAGDEYRYPIPIPLYWRHSLSDRLNLIWALIPIGLDFQAYRSDDHLIGGQLAWSFEYSSRTGFTLYPSLSLFYRLRLARAWALETSAQGNVRLGDGKQALRQSAYLGGLWQFAPAWAARLGILGTRTEIDPIYGSTHQIYPVYSGRADWMFAEQWEVGVEYQYFYRPIPTIVTDYGWTFGGDEEQHSALFKLIHYW